MNIIGCWKERTDIIVFLKANYSDEELKKVFCKPAKSRLDRIVESIKETD